MTVTIASVTFDCADALTVGTFWSAAHGPPARPQGLQRLRGDRLRRPPRPGGWAPVERAQDPTWLFVKVPEPKTAKNRIHLDVAASDPEAEVARLVELGATRVRDTDEFGYRWTVMADPEGNEFCVAKGL